MALCDERCELEINYTYTVQIPIREARRSLTKFMTIIIVALSLEALVLVFETKQEQVSALVYPSIVMGVAVLALVGLGMFQWLSSKADALRPWESEKTEMEDQEGQEHPFRESEKGC